MKKYFFLALRIAVALILIQTLRYKFLAHPDSVYIFTKVGLEPFGRIGIGVLELVASILILITRTSWVGAGLALGILGGAILMHLTVLGIEVNGDNGTLFYLAITTFILCTVVLWSDRKRIPFIGKRI